MDKSLLRPVNEYTIGWICALSIELDACLAVLDNIHSDCGHPDAKSKDNYALGNIGSHNIVVATLPEGVYGNTKAAVIATRLTDHFSDVKFLFMVGIGGGVPNLAKGNDIRLGDVVVSIPEGPHPGVVKWDSGKTVGQNAFNRTGQCNSPPDDLLTLIPTLKSRYLSNRGQITTHIRKAHLKQPHRHDWVCLGEDNDNLYHASYEHEQKDSKDCSGCDPNGLVQSRPRRGHTNPIIHYGIIASGDSVIKTAVKRDELSRDLNAKCIEMEGAGTMAAFSSCLVVRGICDYADTHKNKDWQPYAALTAAAYTKELLEMLSPVIVQLQPTAQSMQTPQDVLTPPETPPLPPTRLPTSGIQNGKPLNGTRPGSEGNRYRIRPNLAPAQHSSRDSAGPQTTTRPDGTRSRTTQAPPALPVDPSSKRHCIAAVRWSNWNYRLYFQDQSGVCEASRDTDKWNIKKLPDIDAAPYTPLAAVSRKGGTDIRLYYLAPDLILRERRFTSSRGWFAGTLDQSKIKVAANSRLAAIEWSGHITKNFATPMPPHSGAVVISKVGNEEQAYAPQ
ncbi:hypothetical protein ABW21_db0208792 [Orbilia brochopaga]|nr:hypothetical protein ABW21_db0208792 [Drechslerella brochopaga]